MGARPYDPALGRFLSVDLVDGGSANAYDYSFQVPLNAFDLDGRCVGCIAKLLGKIASKAPKKAPPKLPKAPPPISATLGPLSKTQHATYTGIVSNTNKMNHIFDPKHNLNNMVVNVGSREAVAREVVMNLGRVPSNQPFRWYDVEPSRLPRPDELQPARRL